MTCVTNCPLSKVSSTVIGTLLPSHHFKGVKPFLIPFCVRDEFQLLFRCVFIEDNYFTHSLLELLHQVAVALSRLGHGRDVERPLALFCCDPIDVSVQQPEPA